MSNPNDAADGCGCLFLLVLIGVPILIAWLGLVTRLWSWAAG